MKIRKTWLISLLRKLWINFLRRVWRRVGQRLSKFFFGNNFRNDPQGWANEGLDIAGQNVYDGLVEGEALSDDYISQSKILCRKRIALAGYRLAFVLKEALANQKRLLIKNEDN